MGLLRAIYVYAYFPFKINYVPCDLKVELCADFIMSAAARRSILVGGSCIAASSAQFSNFAYLFQMLFGKRT